jgi:hypothetical protein
MKNFIYILLIAPLFIISSCEEEAIHGCLDSQALNYNPEASLDNNSCEYIELGVLAEGGIVFYIDGTGEHGLVAAMEDLDGFYEWGCHPENVNGADGTVIGTGYQNTLDIVEGCSETPIAASESLSHETGDYSDWYLPSKDELVEMYNTIGNGSPDGNIGGFLDDWYWSSSEDYSVTAWSVPFNNGLQTLAAYDKSAAHRVRVIRAF